MEVSAFCRKYDIQPFTAYFPLDMYFFLENNRSDSHNYKKLIFDALERGGLCDNDKWIMDRTQSIEIDKERPKIVVEFNR